MHKLLLFLLLFFQLLIVWGVWFICTQFTDLLYLTASSIHVCHGVLSVHMFGGQQLLGKTFSVLLLCAWWHHLLWLMWWVTVTLPVTSDVGDMADPVFTIRNLLPRKINLPAFFFFPRIILAILDHLQNNTYFNSFSFLYLPSYLDKHPILIYNHLEYKSSIINKSEPFYVRFQRGPADSLWRR